MKASSAAGDDGVRIGAPDKGPCPELVVLGDKTIDRGLQIDDGAEHAMLQTPACEFGEEALDGVHP